MRAEPLARTVDRQHRAFDIIARHIRAHRHPLADGDPDESDLIVARLLVEQLAEEGITLADTQTVIDRDGGT